MEYQPIKSTTESSTHPIAKALVCAATLAIGAAAGVAVSSYNSKIGAQVSTDLLETKEGLTSPDWTEFKLRSKSAQDVALSDDGSKAYVIGDENSVFVYDTSSGQLIGGPVGIGSDCHHIDAAAGHIAVTCSEGVYSSLNDGTSFSRASGIDSGALFTNVRVAPGGNFVCATSEREWDGDHYEGGNLYLSDDGGESFHKVGNSLMDWKDCGVSKNGNRVVAVASGGPTDDDETAEYGIYMSKNNGESFNNVRDKGYAYDDDSHYEVAGQFSGVTVSQNGKDITAYGDNIGVWYNHEGGKKASWMYLRKFREMDDEEAEYINDDKHMFASEEFQAIDASDDGLHVILASDRIFTSPGNGDLMEEHAWELTDSPKSSRMNPIYVAVSGDGSTYAAIKYDSSRALYIGH